VSRPWLLAAALVFAVLAVGGKLLIPIYRAGQARKVVTWNVAAGAPVPGTMTMGSPGEYLVFIDPCSLSLTLPGGEGGTYAIDEALIRGAPGTVRGVTLRFPAEAADLARARTLLLLAEWRLPGVDDFTGWVNNGCPVRTVTGLTGRNWETTLRDGPMTVGVLVRAGSMDGPGRMWMVELSFGFNPPLPVRPGPATSSSARTPAR
jgi:hypothetical protein